MNSVVIIQARMGSSRLPGKILLEVAGKSLLEIEIGRILRSRVPDAVCVATTRSPMDDMVEEFCLRMNIPVHRGSEEDVLERYYEAASFMKADEIIRVTADCPLLDPEVLDAVVLRRRETNTDYASNTLKRTYPRGLDVECFSFAALSEARSAAGLPWEREHVTPYFYGHPERFALESVEREPDESAHRWTVDMPEDFTLISLVLNHFSDDLYGFRYEDVLRLLAEKPSWRAINAHIEQKAIKPGVV